MVKPPSMVALSSTRSDNDIEDNDDAMGVGGLSKNDGICVFVQHLNITED